MELGVPCPSPADKPVSKTSCVRGSSLAYSTWPIRCPKGLILCLQIYSLLFVLKRSWWCVPSHVICQLGNYHVSVKIRANQESFPVFINNTCRVYRHSRITLTGCIFLESVTCFVRPTSLSHGPGCQGMQWNKTTQSTLRQLPKWAQDKR